MHPRDRQSLRRVHSAEFKAKVLAECQGPGVSIAAVALANGLNANLVRKWLQGRGLQRSGLTGDGSVAKQASGPAARAPALQFVPVDLAAAVSGAETDLGCGTAVSAQVEPIQVELCRGDARLAVRWPASQAQECAGWLRELASQVLK